MRKRLGTYIIAITVALSVGTIAMAQPKTNVVKWVVSFTKGGDGMGVVTLKATIRPTWHMYGTEVPDGGPIPTSIKFEEIQGVTLIGAPTPDKKAEIHKDPNFMMDIPWFSGEVTFTQKFKVVDAAKLKISGYVRYMTCNDETCLPPKKMEFSGTINDLK